MGIKRIYIFGIVFWMTLFASIIPEISSAQNLLDRISMTERSDGLGYVVRFHLTEPADSFQISQPEKSLIQILVYKFGLNSSNVELPQEHGLVSTIRLQSQKGGLAAEIELVKDSTFIADMYRDGASDDLLLALQRVTAGEILDVNQNSAAIIQSSTSVASEWDYTEEENTSDSDESSDNLFIDSRKDEVESPHLFQRISPDDPFILYLRMIADEYHPLGYNGNLRPGFTNTSKLDDKLPLNHPWRNHSFFRPELIELGTPGLSLYAPTFFGSTNDEIPWGNNDGPLWQGKGLNSRIIMGLRYQRGPLIISIKPEFIYSENQEYRLSRIPVQQGLSEFALPLTFADAPVRFGTEPVTKFNPGDSFIQLSHAGVSAGLSHERLWTGPAIYNPLIFGNNASGFFHGYLNPEKPIETGIGKLEGKWLWGGLRESDFFDADSTNNLRYITAFTLNFSPKLLPWFSLGINRVYTSSLAGEGFQPSDLLSALRPWPRQGERGEESNSPDDYFVLSSLFATFTLPEEGFEFYAEWGRNDYRRPLRDFLSMPGLNSGYVLGFWKRFNLTETKRLLFNMEMTHMENSTVTEQLRDYNIWYTSQSVPQGFTNQGQILGSGIGPGASTQKFTLNYYDKWGYVGASLARVAHNMDRHFKYQDFFLDKDYVGFEGALLTSRHEIEFRYQFEALLFLPLNFELQATYSIGKIENRYNIRLFDLTNRNIALTLRYAPPGFLR
jgi:hypothetical protein